MGRRESYYKSNCVGLSIGVCAAWSTFTVVYISAIHPDKRRQNECRVALHVSFIRVRGTERERVHGGFHVHEAQPVIVYAIRNQQFTIKRNIYELTRTNFIIWILVKTRLPHSNSNSHSILVIWQQISLGCHNFCCSFDALHCFFLSCCCCVCVSYLHKVYISGYPLACPNVGAAPPQQRDKTFENKIPEFVLSILCRVSNIKYGFPSPVCVCVCGCCCCWLISQVSFSLHRLCFAFAFNRQLVNKIHTAYLFLSRM